ncbi:hypothetical protein M8C21_008497 [Ambrosia artemisiifolia]|uniref:Peptide-N(4)-(N-acetyl-beta-glucosaminyl)asparagine amidase n=1 Tax=Ambrosia artemisiifolia TaxID=4212 RepID=A0AAD5GUT2_AMBAR|nr:hypothetical protein M8C21_008497 [Ambrosia artemisiifolia]
MVARKFIVHHQDSNFDVDYDTEDGFDVFKFQLFSLTAVPPDDQKIFGVEDNRTVTHDSDLIEISDKLRLVSVNDQNPEFDSGILKSDEELARMLQEEEDALMLQQFAVSEDSGQFEQRVRPYIDQILLYEDSHRQEAARKTVPVEKLEEKALVALAKDGNLNPSKTEVDHAFLLQLLFWFKQTFKWVNSPPCEGCGNETAIQGMGVANSSELAYGASRVEVYRWMHLDPCEGIYDTPLLYEKGWNKKLSYAIALAKDGVYDVTKRYTRKWHEVLSRRTLTTESSAANVLANLTRELRRNLTSVISELEERDRNEAIELEKSQHSQENDSLSLPGRLSGDKEWRTLRSEIGSDSLSSSSCPVRVCTDEHVSRIYDAFSPLISHLAEFSSKNKALEALQFIRTVLADLKKSPFKARRVVIDSNKILDLLPSFNPMLDALSLKSKVETNGKVEICLDGDNPVKASVALPVVFHALDDVIYHIKLSDNFNKSNLSWPLLKLNRICCGSVLASGEELPFGIATSAFDGTRMSKWEEPNGAKGCWLIYKAMGTHVYELCSYELMSANDAPERDPKDWVVEGSDDGGSSWRVLDEQTCQTFDNRFQRKAYKVKLQGFLANVFRFRFLAVNGGQAASRFQIGSIDLYASSNVNQKPV